jgi:Resolvase, N terminal domain
MASADTKPNRRARSPSVRAPYFTLTVEIHLWDRWSAERWAVPFARSRLCPRLHHRQQPHLQVDALERAGCYRVFTETASGARADRGVGFRSLQEAIDTTTPGGKLVFHVFAALAEFERDLIRERTAAGLAAARARGRHGGRPSVMTTQAPGGPGDVPLGAVHRGRDRKTLGVSRASVYRHLTGDSC